MSVEQGLYQTILYVPDKNRAARLQLRTSMYCQKYTWKRSYAKYQRSSVSDMLILRYRKAQY
jgi:hypothetical protein